jgi:hypothetical protein
MVNEASDELEAIDWYDRMKPEVLVMRVDLYRAAKNWELMWDIAKHLAESYPDQSESRAATPSITQRRSEVTCSRQWES